MTDSFLAHYGQAGAERLGLVENNILYALSEAVPSLDWLLTQVPAGEVLARLAAARGEPVLESGVQPRLRLGDQEVWAAGVTYKQSEEARERESHNSTIYTRVYDAQRPELFFKALGRDVISSGEPAGIRYDATWSVPEPELAIVLNAHLEVVGFTIGNDMSSRDIEGENPLYLPQAKVYESSCVLGPRLWLQPNADGWPDVKIHVAIVRNGKTVFSGQTSTERLHRSLRELVGYLGRCKRFRGGAVLLTGTGVVPPDSFTLEEGDEVRIRIDPIGELTNPIVVIRPVHS